MPELRGPAPAKVNLALEVLGVREDGYHEIDTVLQTLELADTVTLTPAAAWSVRVGGAKASGTPGDETNLALKAARLLGGRLGRADAFSIALDKQIPAAGGLGGGASDAATTLRLLQRAWPEASDADLLAVANAVGSDEAFFLAGGTARATGRGETVTPLPPLPPHDVVLFVPAETIERKTARMFAALDRLPFDAAVVTRRFVEQPPRCLRSADVFNAFERVAFELFPWLAELWEDLEGRAGEPVRLAGAGPCLFWIGPRGGGEAVARAATGARCEVLLTRTAGTP